MIFLGVDPGLDGALVSLSEDCKFMTVSDFSKDENGRVCCRKIHDVVLAIKSYHNCKDIICCLEKSHSMKGQGVTSSFNYGFTYGVTYSALRLAGVRIKEITPQKWKKEFDLNSNKKLGIIKDKEDAVNIAIELFPSRADFFKRATTRSKKGYVIYDGRADATLIAEYCRRVYK